MKALLVRLSSLGDVVHTLPALAALRKHGWQAGWIAETPGCALLEGNPALKWLVPIPKAASLRLGVVRRTARRLREHGFDVALDLQGLWKSAFWARLAHAPRLVGYASTWRREPASAWLIGEPFDLPASAVHVIDKNLSLLRAVGIDAVGLREFPLPPTDAQAERVAQRLAELGLDEYVVINPGGGWSSKVWPSDRYGTVARAIKERGLQVVVTWGPGEEKLAERVVAAADGGAVACFPTTILELVEVLRRARLVVAGDTGPLQLACALATPVVGIFGPTDPARNGPFSRDDIVVRRTPLCAPCHKKRCATHQGVMEAIQIEEVVRAVDKRLGLVGYRANV